MLKKILSGESCAKCRLCCIFDRYDVWETPVFTEEIKNRILENAPGTEFAAVEGGYMFRVREFDSEGLFRCPALTEKGCMLGDEKPFDCRIWPYRVMNVGGRRAITIASICDELYSRPLSQLVDFLKDGLGSKIFAYAKAHPEIVKEYYTGYPVLMFENE